MTGPAPPRLVCVACSREQPWSLTGTCPSCAGLLDVEYDLARATIGREGPTMERFRDLLPLQSRESIFDNGDGNTRCLHLRQLGRALGLEALWVKVEADNPTRTVKDRQGGVVVAALREFGVREFVSASTGNACTSMARVLERFPDMTLHAFVGDEFLDRVAHVGTPNVRLYWTPNESFVGACEAAAWFAGRSGLVRDDGFFFFGRREGLKTVYLEAAPQVGKEIEFYVQGVSSAIGVYAAYRAAQELRALGHTRTLPRLVCVQEDSCAPMARAFSRGAATVDADDIVRNPRGIAKATHRGNPSRTYPIIRKVVLESGGTMMAVDREAIERARELAFETEGLDICAASSLTIAAAAELAQSGHISAGAVILLNLTGADRAPSVRPADFIVEREGTDGGSRRTDREWECSRMRPAYDARAHPMTPVRATELSGLAFTRADIDTTIPARFEQVARHSPEHLALSGGGRHWTYHALNRHANRIAHAIRGRTERTVGPVAFLLEQSPEMVVATLGVLKAGKAYLALHPGMPRAAAAEIVTDVRPELILTSGTFAARARELAAESCDVLAIEEIGEAEPADDPPPVSRPHDPATVFFTSGTTGRPKGVVRSHRAVLHRVWLSALNEAITPADRQSLLTHCSFGASQADLAGALLLGATLCVFDVAPEGLTAFGTWLEQEQITLLRPPVQLFRRWLTTLEPERRFPSVRLVSLGGDVVLPADLELWKRHFTRPSVVLHRFSTTETTLLTMTRIDHDTVLSPEVIAAGSPVADKVLTLIDSDGRAVPVGETGELVVTSAFLADGYWGSPEDTARMFTPDAENPERRSYRTGDLGQFLPDGRFVFLGRRDHQVKIRGYRVDIHEVEAAVQQLDDVSDAAVVAVKEDGEQRLLACVVVKAGLAFDPGSLRQRLRTRLPEWKIPARFSAIPSLPMTPSGKIDRPALIEHAAGQQAAAVSPECPSTATPPTDELERQIAAVFQRVLRCGPVNRSDDFFLLGGDSLQATVLHQQLEHLIGLQIPLETLVKDATVAGIAGVIRAIQQSASSGTTARPPVLIPLRHTGTQPNLFLVHGRTGQAFVSPHFLETFGADQPVYAFQATGLDRSRMPNNTIEEMAGEYVRALRRVQPAGPYFLGAVCAGGLVAIEMANQLRGAGVNVGPLLLINPPANPAGGGSWWRRSWALTRSRVRRLFLGKSSEKRTISHLLRRGNQGRIALESRNPASLEAAAALVADFEIARLKYRGWHYDGPVLMLRSSVRLRRDGPGKRGVFGRRLTGEVQWFDAGSTHGGVRRVGNDQLAGSLRQAVTIAQDALAAMRDRASGSTTDH